MDHPFFCGIRSQSYALYPSAGGRSCLYAIALVDWLALCKLILVMAAWRIILQKIYQVTKMFLPNDSEGAPPTSWRKALTCWKRRRPTVSKVVHSSSEGFINLSCPIQIGKCFETNTCHTNAPTQQSAHPIFLKPFLFALLLSRVGTNRVPIPRRYCTVALGLKWASYWGWGLMDFQGLWFQHFQQLLEQKFGFQWNLNTELWEFANQFHAESWKKTPFAARCFP